MVHAHLSLIGGVLRTCKVILKWQGVHLLIAFWFQQLRWRHILKHKLSDKTTNLRYSSSKTRGSQLVDQNPKLGSSVVLIMEDVIQQVLVAWYRLRLKTINKTTQGSRKLIPFGNVQSPLGPEAKPVEKHLAHFELVTLIEIRHFHFKIKSLEQTSGLSTFPHTLPPKIPIPQLSPQSSSEQLEK